MNAPASHTATPADVLAGRARWCVVEGDCADVLRALPDGGVDALVSDPPSGIAFMGAEWDRNKGGRSQWVAWLSGILADARRATRDGGRALVWSLPRTSHWTGCAVEDAGWSIETTIAHLFGTGWPKGKAQTKPAQETWWLARTGRSEALNIEACRVGTSKRVPGSTAERTWYGRVGATADDQDGQRPNVGRYPPNLVTSHAAGCVCEGTRRVVSDSANAGRGRAGEGFRFAALDGNTGHADPDGTESVEAWRCAEGCPVAELDRQSGERRTSGNARPTRQPIGYGGAQRTALPIDHRDTGTASRYFPQFPADDPDAPWSEALFRYVAKPSRAERNNGGVDNIHSTVKPVALMRWLIRLVTKPGDVVLDPFGGSGTTGVAALLEGRRVILVEREPQYAAIARARIAAAEATLPAQLDLLAATGT
jgi:hypothetical protein